MSIMLLNQKDIKILSAFSKDYHGRIYGREISKKLKINQKTISNILNKLERGKILKYIIEGKNKYYFLNNFNLKIKEIISIIELNRKLIFLDKNKSLDSLFEEISKRSKGIVIIFGSYASGKNNKDSDLDLFVLGNISEVGDLEELYNLKINVVKSNKKKFDEKNHLFKEIISNHIIIKGFEEFTNLIW